MKTPNMQTMQNFTVKNIPFLDTCVLAALELFSQTKIPQLNVSYKHPLVVGSGNAAATGKILFEDSDVVFADESSFENKLKHIKSIDGIVLISASGEKHAPIIAKKAKRYKKRMTLLTNNPKAQAKEFSDVCYVLPKNREPYTYNTSTYMGPIFGKTKEDPKKVLNYIKKSTSKLKMPDFKKYKKYYFVVPEEFEGIIRLLNVKFIELFGRNVARDIETFEYIPHATTVVQSDELFISFGKRVDKVFAKNQFHVPLPKNVDYGAMMAIGYYIVGQIQRSQPQWFKKNIVEYMKKASKIFGHEMKAIVE
ncbi:hypothetical protein HOI26_04585 [Candidatus Woesearchaeota archaeon]|jgi:hypothetical protein|nr:hypothetical protein [Candidatus Woesearchaeota archaeon]